METNVEEIDAAGVYSSVPPWTSSPNLSQNPQYDKLRERERNHMLLLIHFRWDHPVREAEISKRH